MRKNVCYFLLALLCLFAFSGVVNADEQTNKEGASPSEVTDFKCDSSVKAKGLASAAEVKVAYETVEFKSEKAPNTIFYYVDIYVYNLEDQNYITVTNGKNGKSFDISTANSNPEGVIKLRQKDTSKVVNYTFEVKANTASCYGETLRTIRLSVPRYNNLSERALCDDIPDYYMCQRFVNYDIDASRFLNDVTKYKESLANKDTKKIEEGKAGFVTKTTKAIANHRFLIIGLVLIAGAVGTVLVIKKRRSVL